MQTVPAGERPGKTESAEATVAEGEAVRAQERTCATCRAWVEPRVSTDDLGTCQRRSPQALPSPLREDVNRLSVWTVWPETAPGEFCCDWLPTEPPR